LIKIFYPIELRIKVEKILSANRTGWKYNANFPYYPYVILLTTHAIEVGVENKSKYVLKLNDLNRDANMLTSLSLIACMSYPTARKHMCVYYIGTDVYMQTYNNHFYRNLIVIW